VSARPHALAPHAAAGSHLITRWPRALAATVPAAWAQLAIVLGMLAGIPFARSVDNDFWWHLRTGELIVHGGIPRHDPYSWTAGGQPWAAHEWLSEVLIYASQTAFGYAATVGLFTCVAIGALLLSYALARRLGAGARPLLALMVLAVLVFAIFVTPRPQAFTWLLFAAYVMILARDDAGERAVLWALPPLMLLWANLHLGFVFGLMLVGCWLASLALDAVCGRDVGWRTPLAVAAACVAAACVNPSGPAILWYPARYLLDGSVTNSMVAEWQRPDPLALGHAPIFACAALVALGVALPSRPRPFLCLAGLVSVALSMLAVRNAPFVALMLFPVAGRALAARWPRLHRGADGAVRVPALATAALAIGVAMGMAAMSMRATGAPLALGAPPDDGYPAGAAAYVQAHHAGQRLFNDYNYGGFLIGRLFPRTPVFVDGRTDFYGDALLRDYVTIEDAQPGWRERLDAYGVEVVLTNARSPLAAALASDAGWSGEYGDGTHVVFGRMPGR
jgi:hypothetical protein